MLRRKFTSATVALPLLGNFSFDKYFHKQDVKLDKPVILNWKAILESSNDLAWKVGKTIGKTRAIGFEGSRCGLFCSGAFLLAFQQAASSHQSINKRLLTDSLDMERIIRIANENALPPQATSRLKGSLSPFYMLTTKNEHGFISVSERWCDEHVCKQYFQYHIQLVLEQLDMMEPTFSGIEI